MIPPDTKSLRRDIRARRAGLSPAFRIAAATQVADRLRDLPGLPGAGHVAGYWAVGGEVALHSWQVALPPGLVYCLPVLGDEGVLRFAPWRAGDPLVANRFGIPEPDVQASSLLEAAQLALAVVPLVAFDARCHRIGMGGGWYDRTFAARDAAQWRRPMLVGAAYEIQRVATIEPAPWDVHLDAVCTEAATYLRDQPAA